ncbi:MAG: hypothetical protein N4A53_05325 [Pelagimonas sp.]|jgi:phosphatidylserine/phosphatidylglycerophosphate/cardiolipin synthase-like enzyme|nr:hypothetical protein [Pelagimonas sp.]
MSSTALIGDTEGLTALETAVASARSELLIALRGLDPRRALHHPKLREAGLENWADLIGILTQRGVALRLLVGDSDPLLHSADHRAAWAAASGFADVVQGNAQILCAPHAHRPGALWHWQNRATLSAARKALATEDPARLTPVQRRARAHRLPAHPQRQNHSFVLVDGKLALLGAPSPDFGQKNPWLRLDDADFCGALRAHFGALWDGAMSTTGQDQTPLAQAPARFSVATIPQSRSDLRLLRTLSRPDSRLRAVDPKPGLSDLDSALPRLLRGARHSLSICSPALTDPDVIETLSDCAIQQPELGLTLLVNELPPEAEARLNAGFGPRLIGEFPSERVQSSVILIDGQKVIFGSPALSPSGLRFDSEVAALIKDSALAQQLQQALFSL